MTRSRANTKQFQTVTIEVTTRPLFDSVVHAVVLPPQPLLEPPPPSGYVVLPPRPLLQVDRVSVEVTTVERVIEIPVVRATSAERPDDRAGDGHAEHARKHEA
jgi:hypothetical protein